MAEFGALDGRRGHSLLPHADVLAAIPPLYATDGVRFEDKIIYVHYFVAAANWYVAEYDPEEMLAFGLCDLGQGFPEWGYVSLRELDSLVIDQPLRITEVSREGTESVRHATMPVLVERDLHFTPKRFGDVDRSEG